MAIEAWPFLVSRGKRIGFSVIVAPDFLVQSGQEDLLALAAGGDETRPNHANHCQVFSSNFGELVLIFQVIPATDVHGELMVDWSGRNYDRIEGVVCCGSEDM